jgi:hypothetical protein
MSSQPDAAYAVTYDLRHFVAHANLVVARGDTGRAPLHEFRNGSILTVTDSTFLPPPVKEFVVRSARLTEALVDADRLRIGPAGASVEGVGLERVLIAFELAHMYQQQDLDFWTNGSSTWLRDITHLLSFFSQTAQRRYEKATGQLTVAYYPEAAPSDAEFGQLGKPLLDEYKAFLRLCRDAHTVLVVHRDSVISGLKSDLVATVFPDNFQIAPVPPRLEHLCRMPEKPKEPIVFNLNSNGSMEILAKSKLVFRRVNNVWRFATLDGALDLIKSELTAVGGAEPGLVARNFLSLALDLADRGEGALLFLCDEPTVEIFSELFDSLEGVISTVPRFPAHEIPARARFTRLVGDQKLSLRAGPFGQLSPLLADVCSIDGATVFSYGGDLLGFGCIVRLPAVSLPGKKEGARSAAAKAVSAKGVAIKVSTDGDATLFLHGQEWATFC